MVNFNDGWTIPELKVQLKEWNLPTTGKKADLITRLEAEYTKEDEPAGELVVGEATAPELETKMDALGKPLSELVRTIHQLIAELQPIITPLAAYLKIRASVPSGGQVTPGPALDLSPTAPEASRDTLRDTARKLLGMQPDGRERTLETLEQYGGNVSAVESTDIAACLDALLSHIKDLEQ